MKRTHLAGLVFVVVAIGAIISTVYKADTYASFADARMHPDREFHIIGDLLPEMPIRERVVNNTLTLTFYMRDAQGNTEEVLYFGSRPQDFELSDEVVLIGKYEETRFVASSLLLKCPSKYRPDEIGQTEYSFE